MLPTLLPRKCSNLKI